MSRVGEPIRLNDWLQSKAALVPFSLDQYHQMIRQGLLPEGAPVEFIDGFLVLKDRSRLGADPMTVYPPHSVAVQKLARLDAQVQSFGLHVRTQQPITLPKGHEPEPDGAIVRGGIEDYAARHPFPLDILCVIEVADSSLEYDRTTKQRIYATAGIPLYVLINLVERVVEVREGPDASTAAYGAVHRLPPGGTVIFHLGHAGVLSVPASDLLP